MVDVRFVSLAACPGEQVVAVAARVRSQTVGLALADLLDSGAVKVRSFFVEPEQHRKGIGSGLCAALEDRAREMGAKSVEAMYEASGPFGPAAQKIAEKRGWKPSQPPTLVCRSNWNRIKQAPFIDRPLPSGYEIFSWTDLQDSDRQAIREEHERAPFYPEALSPFAGPAFEPLNSVGLRKDGRVVGWMITHRMGPSLISYSSLFVREEERGTGMALLTESMKRAVQGGVESGIFGVNNLNRTMIGVMAKHLRPYLEEYREIVYVACALAAAE